MIALALDLGTKVALGAVEGGMSPRIIRAIAMPDPRDRELRYGRLHALLVESVEELHPDVVATEPAWTAEGDPNRQAGLHQAIQQGIVRAVCLHYRIPFRTYAAGAWRLAACGRGNATKEQAVQAICQRYGIAVPASEHVGDVLALAHCTLVRFAAERAAAGQGVLSLRRRRKQQRWSHAR